MNAFQLVGGHFLVFDFANIAIDSANKHGERFKALFHKQSFQC